MKRLIRSGARYNHDKYLFDWDADIKGSDVLMLSEDTSGTVDTNGVVHIYGYHINPSCIKEIRDDFISKLKHNIYSTDIFIQDEVQKFVLNGIYKLENFIKFEDIGATVKIESDENALLGAMEDVFVECLKCREINLTLLKELYENVKFDVDKACEVLIADGFDELRAKKYSNRIARKFDKLKGTDELFQIHKFTPSAARIAFSEFLRFGSEEHRNVYENLQNVTVLLYDEFLTSGATLLEANRYLKFINPNNTLVSFVLIKIK